MALLQLVAIQYNFHFYFTILFSIQIEFYLIKENTENKQKQTSSTTILSFEIKTFIIFMNVCVMRFLFHFLEFQVFWLAHFLLVFSFTFQLLQFKMIGFNIDQWSGGRFTKILGCFVTVFGEWVFFCLPLRIESFRGRQVDDLFQEADCQKMFARQILVAQLIHSLPIPMHWNWQIQKTKNWKKTNSPMKMMLQIN